MNETSPFSEEEIQIIIAANYGTSVLNLLGALFTIVTFLLFREARNGATALVFCLALSDLCTACATAVLWVFTNGNVALFPCYLQAFMLMFGLCASMMWALMIGCYMFLALYKNIDLETLDKFRFVFHMISWGYAFMAAAAPFFDKQGNGYGLTFPGHRFTWCWIYDPKSVFRMFLYFPDTLIFITLTVLYGLTRHRLRKRQGGMANEICKKMSIYLLVYIFINLFAIINRFQNFFGHGKIIFPLFILQFLTQPMQGLLNAIAYMWNEPAYIEQYKQLFARCINRPLKKTKIIQSAENARLLKNIVYDDIP